ncbi:MAG: hypothetical protein AABW51_05340 [Nanoarchaeota archaeon]
MVKSSSEEKNKTLFLILISYLIPIVIFILLVIYSTFNTSFKLILGVSSLIPAGVIVTLVGIISALIFGVEIIPPSEGGIFIVLFLPITIIASFIFWNGLVWIIYNKVNNKFYSKLKSLLFFISTLLTWILFSMILYIIELINAVGDFYKNLIPFVFLYAVLTISLLSFFANKIYKRLVNEAE